MIYQIGYCTVQPTNSVVVAVDDYRKESTKNGERKNRREEKDEGKRIHEWRKRKWSHADF